MGVYNKTSDIATFCGDDPKVSALAICTGDTTATPTGFFQIVCNYVPVRHAAAYLCASRACFLALMRLSAA